MSSRPRALLFVVLAAASWGIGTVLSKQAVTETPPLTLLAAQLIVSVGILSLAVWRSGTRVRGTDRRLALLGALNPGLAYALSLVGLTMISASASVLIWALEPIGILLVAGAVLGERPGWAVAWLSLVALAGLGIAVGSPDGGLAVAGVVVSIAGVLCCVAYSVATRRWIDDEPSTLNVVFSQQAVALGVVVPVVGVAAIAGVPAMPNAISPAGLASIVASGVLYYAAAYLLYLNGLRILSVSIAAMSFYLVPLFGLAAATASGERLDPLQWFGALLTIGAVLAVGLLEIRRAEATQVAPA